MHSKFLYLNLLSFKINVYLVLNILLSLLKNMQMQQIPNPNYNIWDFHIDIFFWFGLNILLLIVFLHILFIFFLIARKRTRVTYIIHVSTTFCGWLRIQREHVGHTVIPSLCKRLCDYLCTITIGRRSSTRFWFLNLSKYL